VTFALWSWAKIKFLLNKMGKMRDFKANSSAHVKVLNKIESKQAILLLFEIINMATGARMISNLM
jgi:pyruvate kinase